MAIVFIIILLGVPFIALAMHKTIAKNSKDKRSGYEYFLIVATIFSLFLLSGARVANSADYYTAIDIVDNGYTPFANAHLPTLLVFYLLAFWGTIALWLGENSLPPLSFTLAVIVMLIGCLLSAAILIQVASNNEQSDIGWVFSVFPICMLLNAFYLFNKALKQEQRTAVDKIYDSKLLNDLNQFLLKSKSLPQLILLLTIPVFIIIVVILMLFGQDYNSITKAFTETATWTFSQKSHPPFLDHRGHYLCTVAVCGDPQVVKPLRIGKRHGQELVVNRQLLVANAFEELIQDSAPRLHKIIRRIYDQYGYPLSKKINTAKNSNLVYRLMKPLEYFFVITLYLCCIAPEKKIAKQYSL